MKQLKYLIFLLIISVIFEIPSFAQNKVQSVFKVDSITTEIELNQLWKFQKGDNFAWSHTNFDDKNWDSLQPNFNISTLNKTRFEGQGWFRLHIKIDSSLQDQIYTLNINQEGASEIYINGKLIKRFGKVKTSTQEEETYNPKHLSIVNQFSDTLNYVIAVRYSNIKAYENYKKYNKDKAGFVITISTYDTAIKAIATLGNIRIVFTVILSVFLSIAFLHLLLFLFYSQQQSNLYFFLFMIAVSTMWFLVLHTFSISENPASSMRTNFYLRLGISLSFTFLSIFVYSIFYEKFPKISWFIIALIPIMTLLILFNISYTRQIISFINLFILIDVIRNIARAIFKKTSGAWIIGAGFLLFILFFILVGIMGITSNADVITSPGSTFAYIVLGTFVPGVVSIPLSMSVYLAHDFAKTNKDLAKQLETVKSLSAKTIQQEREKKKILENQKEKLEVMVDERTHELEKEKEKTEELLLNTLPLKVVKELKKNGKSEPVNFDDVTVYFSDIVGFTKISSTLEPKVLINELNDIFTAFDDIMVKNKCERIKTIGDAYLAVSGMPRKNKKHAENMIEAALEIRQYLKNRNTSSSIQWQARIGIHSGKVVGGIVGVRKYIYDVFGDTINTASRMESNSEPMRINVSETTHSILKDSYQFTEREVIHVKGKGKLKMYFLDGKVE